MKLTLFLPAEAGAVLLKPRQQNRALLTYSYAVDQGRLCPTIREVHYLIGLAIRTKSSSDVARLRVRSRKPVAIAPSATLSNFYSDLRISYVGTSVSARVNLGSDE